MKLNSKEEILAAKKDKAIEMIKENFENSDAWVCRAVVRIYGLQTEDEQMAQTTKENNGVGFNGVDARFLSSLALQIQENERTKKFASNLSPKQMQLAREKIKKYAKQILTLIN